METISRSLLTLLLNALWQIPLVALVAWAVSRIMRNAPANYRHAVWVGALAAALLLPLASLAPRGSGRQAAPYPLRAPETVPMALGGNAANPGSGLPLAIIPARSNVQLARATATIWVTIYLLFLCFRIGRLMLACLSTARIVRDSKRVIAAPRIAAVWKRAEGAFGIGGVELRSSAALRGPVMAGIWRRRIIVPSSLLDEKSEVVLVTALGHEMAHVARRDFAFNALYELVSLPFSWHPFCTLIRREIERTREMACDELVTRRLIKPDMYARSILEIAAGMTGLRRPGYTLGVFDGDILEERVRRLLSRPAENLKRARLMLITGFTALAGCAVIASGLAISARAQSAAAPEMKLGAEAYNSGDYAGALQHFRSAVNIDPADLKAKLYLAQACMDEMADQPPAVRRKDDNPLFAEALRQYRDVLTRDPSNPAAILGFAGIVGPDQWSAAHDLVIKLILADPKNRDAYYAAGVLDWKIAWSQIQQAYTAVGLRPVEQLPDAGTRKSLRDSIQPQLEEGLKMMQLALTVKPDSSDALAYLNLLFRSEALIAETPDVYKELLAKADAYVGKAIQAKRAEAGAATGGVAIDADGIPSLANAHLAPPPPPPPPPPPGGKNGDN